MSAPGTYNIVQARRAFRDRLKSLATVVGSAYTVSFRRTVEADFAPQGDVEVWAKVLGVEQLDQQTATGDVPDGVYDEYLNITVGVYCSGELQNDDTEIDDIVLCVFEDVKQFILSDPTQGGTCRNTIIGDADVSDATDNGYYGGELTVRLRVRTPEAELN